MAVLFNPFIPTPSERDRLRSRVEPVRFAWQREAPAEFTSTVRRIV